MPDVKLVPDALLLLSKQALDLRMPVCHDQLDGDTVVLQEHQRPFQALKFHAATSLGFIGLKQVTRSPVTSQIAQLECTRPGTFYCTTRQVCCLDNIIYCLIKIKVASVNTNLHDFKMKNFVSFNI